MNERNKILIIDDEKINIDILLELLNNTYDVIPVLSGEKALKVLESKEIDLILLDIFMTGMNGYEVCERLKENEETKDIPIIFITAKDDEDSIEKAYDIGGTDYITKPFKPKELLAKVKRELKIQELQDKLKFLASTDPMTKLYNRGYFTKVSKNILNLSIREKQDLSIMILDIDRFKNINDTYGHHVGDEIIMALTNQLTGYHRKSDIVCRYGGDEFVILLPNTSINGANILAKKIRQDVESLIVATELNKNLNFTISLGVSQVDLVNETNIELSLKRADNALYQAKKDGKNMVCINNFNKKESFLESIRCVREKNINSR